MSAIVDYSFCRQYPIESHGFAPRIPINNQDLHRDWYKMINITFVIGKCPIDLDNSPIVMIPAVSFWWTRRETSCTIHMKQLLLTHVVNY